MLQVLNLHSEISVFKISKNLTVSGLISPIGMTTLFSLIYNDMEVYKILQDEAEYM